MDEWALVLNDRIIKRFTIEEGQSLTIGRGQESDIVVDNTAISRQHCSLELKGGTYYLTDLYSLNGTQVNGQKVVSAVPIKKSDSIQVSKFTLQPSETILAEQTVGSFAIAPDEGLDKTIFVTGKSPQKSKPGQYNLTVMSGKAAPSKLSLYGKTSIKVGKAKSCDIVISGLFLGQTQFFITRNLKHLTIIPQTGLRKTNLNGKKIRKETNLKVGDIISAGGVSFKFE